MRRTILTLVALMACKGEAKRHGPALTPLVANQLAALSPECEVRAAPKGDSPTRELRLCRGRSSEMTIHLDADRNIRSLETSIYAPMRDEARLQFEQTLKAVISEKAIAAAIARLGNQKSEPVWIDGVRVNAFTTQDAKQNPRYTVDLLW